MNFMIDVARPEEFLEIAALDRMAWPQAPDTFIPDGEHIWRVWVEYATVLVARNQTPRSGAVTIVGALVMFPTRQSESFLHKIMVHPEHRGAGIGSALMREALTRTNQTVLLTVDPANTAAVKLYENFGYRVRERVDGYYRPHEDRLVMEFRAPATGRAS